MPSGINRVVLCGTIGKYGVEVRYHPSGTPYASFLLAIPEQSQEGKWYSTLIPCECWGKKAEAAGELDPGQLVLFEGKLKRQKKGENEWTMLVSGFEVTPIVAPVPAMTGSN
jgi:single-stranded DNA-binding protein